MRDMKEEHDDARRALLKAAALAAGAGPLAVQAQTKAETNAPRKVLRYAFQIAETGFDPVQIVDLYSRIVTAHIFEGLYEYDHLARPYLIRPATAQGDPEVSEDFRTWTVRVKPGLFFQDDPAFKGKPRELTAHDYVYAFKRFYDPRWKSPAYAMWQELRVLGMAPLRDAVVKDKKTFDYDTEVEGLRALDRNTIRFRFERPQPRFIQTLAGGDLLGAVAREVVEAYGDDIMGHPVGTGPFRLKEWRRSSKIILERNPTYRHTVYDFQPNADDAEGQALLKKFGGRKLPMIDSVEISIIDEAQPRWLSFLQKAQDLLWLLPNDYANIAVPNGQVAPNLARQGLRAYRVLASDVTVAVFNMEDPVVGGYEASKIALRRALALATNTPAEIRLERKGQAVPAQAALTPNTSGYDAAYRSDGYDPARARALLDTYGYIDRDGDGWREQPDGSPLIVTVSTQPDQLSRRLDELMRKDFAAIGIKAEFKPAKWPENLKNVRAGNFMVWRVGSSADAPDGKSALDKGAASHKGGQNLARFENKAYDVTYTRIGDLPDGLEREQLFYQAKRILAAYSPYIWGVHRIITDLAWPWVEGFRRPPYWLNWWECVEIDADEQAKALR